MRKTLLLALGLMLLVVPGAFALITLDSTGNTVFQQTTNNPCVIGDPSCKQPTLSGDTMDYTVNSGAPNYSVTWTGNTLTAATVVTATTTPGVYDLQSPVSFLASFYPGGSLPSFKDNADPYLVSNVTAVTADNKIPGQFTIGIDVNYTSVQEQLVAFKTWVSTDGGVSFHLDTANSYTGPQLLAQHNGNGYSDALLLGFNIPIGDLVFFEAIYGKLDVDGKQVLGGDGDGMEEFFLIPKGSTPIPEPSTMMLLGSGLVGLAGWGRKKFRK